MPLTRPGRPDAVHAGGAALRGADSSDHRHRSRLRRGSAHARAVWGLGRLPGEVGRRGAAVRRARSGRTADAGRNAADRAADSGRAGRGPRVVLCLQPRRSWSRRVRSPTPGIQRRSCRSEVGCAIGACPLSRPPWGQTQPERWPRNVDGSGCAADSQIRWSVRRRSTARQAGQNWSAPAALARNGSSTPCPRR
jgi:hypothetical protein